MRWVSSGWSGELVIVFFSFFKSKATKELISPFPAFLRGIKLRHVTCTKDLLQVAQHPGSLRVLSAARRHC